MTSVLKVDTIQNSTGTDALSIDGSGNVEAQGLLTSRGLSYIPSFSARGAGGGVSATTKAPYSGSETGVTHNIGNHYNYTDKEFTCPVAGLYLFTMTAFSNNSAAGSMRLSVNDNYTENYPTLQAPSGASIAYTMLSISAVLNLEADDTVQAYVKSGSIYFDVDCWFTGVLIG